MFNRIYIDHIFFLTAPATFMESEQTTPFLSPKIDYQGEGTSAKRLNFHQQFFEYLWVERLEESKANALKLHTRVSAAEKGGNPFGICFKGQLAESEKEQFWPYHPPYDSEVTWWVHNSYFTSPLLPALIIKEGSNKDLTNQPPLAHIQTIEYLEMKLPAEGINFSPDLYFEKSDAYELNIYCKGERKNAFPLAYCINLISDQAIKRPPRKAA